MIHELAVAVDDVRKFSVEVDFTIGRGPRWWRRIAERITRWWLRVVGAAQYQEVRYRSFTAPAAQSIIEKLHLQQRDMLRIYNREAKTLFVGPDAMDNLDREECMRMQLFSMGTQDVTINYGRDGRVERRVLGIEVVYVPWMSGALLVPEWRK